MRKSVRLFAILCALCTWAPVPTSATASDNSAGASNNDHASAARNNTVKPIFDFDDPAHTPFPSDHFTIFDVNQNTGVRISLPPRPGIEECQTEKSSLVDTEIGEICLLNELDGFSIRPRLSIPFSGPIDPSTARGNVFLVSLGDSLVNGHPPYYRVMVEADEDQIEIPADAGKVIGVDRGVWDPDTNTLHLQADTFLDQHARYALVVTRGVQDTRARPIEQADGFDRLRGPNDNGSDSEVKAYSQALKLALAVLELKGVHRNDIAVASVFSTLSSTAVLEKVRNHVMSLPTPNAARFDIGPNKSLAIFDLATLPSDKAHSFDFNRQTKTTGPLAAPVDQTSTRLALLRMPELGETSISKVAYGKYSSPNYLDQNGLMLPVATFSGTPVLLPCDLCTDMYHDVYFNVFVPAGIAPPAGWPVVLYGNGSADNMNGGPFNVAEDFASHGFATIGFNLVGQGFGPNTSITFSVNDGAYCAGIGSAATPCRATIGLPGRTVDLNVDGTYTADEGNDLVGAKRLLFGREGNRQNVADIVQLIRVLEQGMDVGGAHLDASHIYFTGLSGGANLGVELAPIEPRIRATGVASAGGWPSPWLIPANRGAVGTFLMGRVPPLIDGTANSLTTFGGVSVGRPFFNENLPPPGQDLVNDAPGAIDIQKFFDTVQWLTSAGSPGAFAPYIRRKSLAGVSPRPFFILMSKGDESVSNLQTFDNAKAGDLADRIVRYRHDVFWQGLTSFWQSLTPAQQANPTNALLKNPHGTINRTDYPARPALPGAVSSPFPPYISAIAPDCCTWRDVSLMAQDQIAYFFLHDYLSMTDSQDIIDPPRDKYHLFEVPAQSIFECGTATPLSNCDFSYIP